MDVIRQFAKQHRIFRPNFRIRNAPSEFLVHVATALRRLIARVIKRVLSRNYEHYSVCQLAVAGIPHVCGAIAPGKNRSVVFRSLRKKWYRFLRFEAAAEEKCPSGRLAKFGLNYHYLYHVLNIFYSHCRLMRRYLRTKEVSVVNRLRIFV